MTDKTVMDLVDATGKKYGKPLWQGRILIVTTISIIIAITGMAAGYILGGSAISVTTLVLTMVFIPLLLRGIIPLLLRGILRGA